MKCLTIVALLLLGSALAYAQSSGGKPHCTAQDASKWKWGAESGGLKIAAAVAKSEFKPGEPIEVHICVQNVSSRALALDHRAGPFTDLAVKDVKSGAELTITNEGRKLVEPSVFIGLISTVVEPGDMREYTFDVGKLFDLSKPGLYSIRASRGARVHRTRSSSGPLAQSQGIEITILARLPDSRK